MKEPKARTPEYLSTDILDEDFVKTFLVFHRLQFILGSSRIESKYQFVTSPTRYQKCYTILCLLATVLVNFFVLNSYFSQIRDPSLYNLSVVAVWSGCLYCFCTTVNARFLNGQSNADFFVRMQKIDRLMGVDRIKPLNEALRYINNGSLLLLLTVFFLMGLSICIKKQLIYFTFFGAFYNHLTGMVEIIYCSNTIIYFIIRLRFVNCIVRNHLSHKKNIKKPGKIGLISNRRLRNLALETHNFASSDTNVYLKELFDGFSMFQMLYRFQLLIFCLKLVNGSLLVFGFILFSVQKNIVDTFEISSLIIFTIIDIFIAIFLGFRLQVFFGEVKETKRLSIAVMAVYSNGPLREKARKMLKLSEETPPRLSIYDMWEMDAGIFLTLFSLITSLIVTLLQFAFL